MNKQLKWVFVCIFLGISGFAFAQDLLCPAGIATAPEAPGYIPAKDGWIFGEWDLRTDFGISEEAKPFIARMAKALEARGIKLVAVPIPSRGIIHADKVDYAQTLAANFSKDVAIENYLAALQEYEALGIMTVNPLDYLKENPDTLDFKLDMHWTPQGARQIARAVAASLNNLPEFQALGKNTFTLTETITTDYTGTYSSQVAELCGTPLPSELLQRYDLTGGASVGLLDSAAPDIILLGTSFSNAQFSFDSFLKESTGVDVLPISINGGSRWYSFEQLFLDSDTPLPKIILWEFPAKTVEGWEITYLRRVTPMIHGACSLENSLISQSTEISPTQPVALQSSEGVAIQGANSFVVLEFPDVTLRNFLLTLKYQDGTQEDVRVNRDERVENNGLFLVELTDGASILNTVEVLDTDYSGGVSARVCNISQ